MDVQGLEAFWWIAQTGSFNRAAERLYLTQPSVTARIQSLEKELGQPLFERKPR
ncbi:MAG: LysR family transcriptional regulator, partial [Firmicutes bacterium]|nr:LysR family transcriptional regulator [Bacillota bacterium]